MAGRSGRYAGPYRNDRTEQQISGGSWAAERTLVDCARDRGVGADGRAAGGVCAGTRRGGTDARATLAGTWSARAADRGEPVRVHIGRVAAAGQRGMGASADRCAELRAIAADTGDLDVLR